MRISITVRLSYGSSDASIFLREEIQSNLLDNKLEEMSLWLNHHNGELIR